MLDQSPISVRWIVFLTIVFFLISCLLYGIQLLSPREARVIFCDVGQGDGAYIRTSEGTDIVIDAGPDNSILSCLGKHMPFSDKTIEYAFLSHPQLDHYGGFLGILRNYHISHFYRSSGDNTAKSFVALKKLLIDRKVDVRVIHAISQLNLDSSSSLTFLWPIAEYMSSDLNDYSEIFILSLDGYQYLFTGDTSPSVLSIIEDIYPTVFSDIAVLKVPHHGSKNGLTANFLKLADPPLSVISVATKNRYHHPSPEVLDYFKALGKKYITTAQQGDIEITISVAGLLARGQDGSVLKLQIPPLLQDRVVGQ